MTNICILKYNNYMNRKVMQPEVSEDGTNTIGQYATVLSYADFFTNVNFFKADGIDTTITLNTTKLGCDYLLEYGSNDIVLSRWFIIENKTTRAGQTILTLRRDLFVDFKNEYVNSPAFIEKATITSDDVAIYNQEEITFNEIKKEETLLKDKTGVPWIVGFIDPQTPGGSYSVASVERPIYGSYTTQQDFFDEIGYNGSSWNMFTSFKAFMTTIQFKPHSSRYHNTFTLNVLRTGGVYYSIVSDSKFTFTGVEKLDTTRESWALDIRSKLGARVDAIKSKAILDNSLNTDSPMAYNGIYVKIGAGTLGTIYKVTVTAGSETYSEIINPEVNSNVFTYIREELTGLYDNFDYDANSTNPINYIYNSIPYTITLSIAADIPQYKITIPATANKLLDAPYKMFAMPLDPVNYRIGAQGPYTTPSRYESLNIATSLATELGGNNAYLYDLQLLPYCPFPELYKLGTSAFVFSTKTSTDHYDREYITNPDGSVYLGFVLFPKLSTFSFNITKELKLPYDIKDIKVVGQCDKYRLCSPNYSAMFDFNLLKSGNISKFNVDCTYKPYNSYMHINPVWSNLYGKDFDDTRGLICQGDFSLPILTDQWKTYEINNKNYLNAFNRQVESIELQNKYAGIQDITNAVTGAATGAAAGALAGGGVGAAVGAAASLGAGIADISINKKLRNESLDLTKDQFKFNLQNIQALPNTLSKVSAYCANNKLFPVLEYYSCTDEEKQIFKNKMEYNGMTVMRIGTISEFLKPTQTYIKGQFIRLESVDGCYDVAKAISEEFYKGVYI